MVPILLYLHKGYILLIYTIEMRLETVYAAPEFFLEQSSTPNRELWAAVNSTSLELYLHK